MPSEAKALTGVLLGGRYRVGQLLGSGGMGAVYEAVQEDLGRRVAVKVLHLERTRETTLKRFRREAEAAAALGHPNIVNVTDFAMNPGEPAYLVMERLDGASLADVIESEDQLPVDRVVFIMSQVLDALAAAHRANIVHRDIKPENIFLTSISGLLDVVKLLDFGVAKVARDTATQLTGANAFIGTPAYMAPEQARAGEIDARTDIYAVGACMYTALTGEPLYAASGPQLMHMIVNSSIVPSVRRLRPDVDEELDKIITRALAKDPNDRFATADDMMEALMDWAPSFIRKSRCRSVRPPLPLPEDAEVTAQLPPKRVSVRGSTVTNNGVLTTNSMARSDRPPPRSREKLRALRFWLVAAPVLAGAVGLLTWPKFRRPALAAAEPDDGVRIACVRNDDCMRAGHPEYVCGRNSTCIPKKGCASNRECIAANSGAAFTCDKEEGVCRPLESEDCKVVADKAAIEDDATFWVGTMFPLKGPDAEEFGIANARAVELGQRDFMTMVGGIPVKGRDQKPRPIGIVQCDDSEDPMRVAHHLADARIPAVIGFGRSQEAVEVSTKVFVPNDMLVFAAPNRSSLINQIIQPKDRRLVYRTTPGDDQYADAIAAFVEQYLEPKIRRERKVENLRVAVLRWSNQEGMTFVDAMFRRLRFNGKPASENGMFYQQWPLEVEASDGESVVAKMLAFRPDIVISEPEADTLTTSVLRTLEARWPAHEPRAEFILDGAGGGWGPEFFAFIGSDASRRHRFFGVDIANDTVPNAQLAAHYNEAFSEHFTSSVTPAATYDAMYAIMYAAASSESLTGRSLARAIARYGTDGATSEVGAAQILTNFNSLAGGKNLNLKGASARLNFNSAGEPIADFAFSCTQVDEAVRAIDTQESGLTFDADSKRVVGSLHCP